MLTLQIVLFYMFQQIDHLGTLDSFFNSCKYLAKKQIPECAVRTDIVINFNFFSEYEVLHILITYTVNSQYFDKN